MSEELKLIFCLQQIENISNLVKGNEWEHFLVSKLISLKVEFERQLELTKQKQRATIKE
jgi:hypothetical protein